MKKYRKYVYMGLPVLGVLFYLAYLHRATIDIIYSDYIRLINSYLPDVWDPKKFFVADLLTRIPINYLERGINVMLFGYSVTFDRVMGVLGFGLSALLIASYCRKKRIGLGWYTAMVVFMFSLNKWEMLYNGTGWVHFLAFACFYHNYLVLDRIYAGRAKKGDLIRLGLLPALITVFIAGPYCAIYIVTLVISYLFILMRNALIRYRERSGSDNWFVTRFGPRYCELSAKQLILLAGLSAWPMLLYLWSHSHAVYDYSGATDAPLLGTLIAQPVFFIKFFLKSFASMVLGTELITRWIDFVPGKVWCLLGLLVILTYFLALWLNFYYRIAEKTIFPLMLLAGGAMNHMMVLITRWIFIPKDIYGMSSRYALQYQIGIIGIFLTFALAAKEYKKAEAVHARSGKTGGDALRRRVYRLTVAVAAVFVIGNVITTAEEYYNGIHRRIHNEYVHIDVWDFENLTDEELSASLEYSKEGIREALTTLKENGWNIFRETEAPYYKEIMDPELD